MMHAAYTWLLTHFLKNDLHAYTPEISDLVLFSRAFFVDENFFLSYNDLLFSDHIVLV